MCCNPSHSYMGILEVTILRSLLLLNFTVCYCHYEWSLPSKIPWSSPEFHSIIFTIPFLMLPKLRNWYIIVKSLNRGCRMHDFNFGHPKWKGMMRSSHLCCWGFRSFKMWCCVIGDQFPAFQSIAEPSCSLTLKMMARWSFKTSGVAHQMTHCDIPENINLLHQLCRF